MRNYTQHITLTKAQVSSEPSGTKAKRWFGKRTTFIDKRYNMKYNKFGTYAENKNDFYDTLSLVYSGKCKNIFEAYKLSH